VFVALLLFLALLSDHEKRVETVEVAVRKLGLRHPVVVDGRFRVWGLYGVRAWPTFVLIDPEGVCRGWVSGEGRVAVLEKQISSLLAEYGIDHASAALSSALSGSGLYPMLDPLLFPGKVTAVDGDSPYLVISDTGHNRLVVTEAPSGKLLAVIGDGVRGSRDGPLSSARFNNPQGTCWDAASQRLYIADAGNHAVRCVDMRQGLVSTIAGGVKRSERWATSSPDAITWTNGIDCPLASPWDLTLLGGLLYIAMSGTHQVWCLRLEDGAIRPFAGTGAEACVNGQLAECEFAQPMGISTDGSQNLFIADSECSSIRRIDLGTGRVELLAGSGSLFGFGKADGCSYDAKFQHPMGVVYSNGVVWVTDTYNSSLRMVDAKTGDTKTYPFVGGSLTEPTGVAIIQESLYVSDVRGVKQVTLASANVSNFSIQGLSSPGGGECVPSEMKP